MGEAFWLNPDWSGGTNRRDGATAFWMRPPLRTSRTYCYRHGNWIDQTGSCPSSDPLTTEHGGLNG